MLLQLAEQRRCGEVMQRRTLGDSGVDLSALTFGSMRMEAYPAPDAHWERLLLYLIDAGITSFHSSQEYGSYRRFCRLIKKVRRMRPSVRVRHIVKLAAPNFDERRFHASLFRTQVESELKNLGADTLDVVQWLVRQTSSPNSEERRLAILREALPDLEAEWTALRAEGKVGALTSFPYTPPFAKEVLKPKICNGLTSYLNPAELDYGDLLDGLAARGQGFIAIRPLGAGKFRDVRVALRFVLLHPAVASTILSVSSISHAEEAVAGVHSVPVDAAEFHRLRQVFAEKNES
jgi:aryl-alcohol dehydrogenase-like predicted oxidoreductase